MTEDITSEVISQITNEEMLNLLGNGQDRSDEASLTKFPLAGPFPHKRRIHVVCKYLNELSAFFENQEAPGQGSIRFLAIGNNTPLDHPTLTQCRPDVAIIQQSPHSSTKPAQLYWSQLEATGEDESSDKPKGFAHAHGVSYSGYLLQARPDYISVPGIFFNATGFKLFLADACQCYATGLIEWNTRIAQRLLYTWFWRLYHPDVDKTIKIQNASSGPPTFNVSADGNTVYEGCSILSTGGPFGRRTTVFEAADVVIKDQFIEIGLLFVEGPILEKVHDKGRFPGVARVGWHANVKSDGKDIELKQGAVVDKIKKRLVLLDKAELLIGAHTVREFLMAVYDLLEVTRILWRKHKILHRDISPNNVLLRDKSEAMTSEASISEELDDMCFSEYLLREKTSSSLRHPPENVDGPKSTLQVYEKPEDPLRLARLSTRIVLIDFDMSEDQTPAPDRIEQPKDRTGTLIFMARTLRAGFRREGNHQFSPIPRLDAAHDVYQKFVGDRLQTFPPNIEEFLRLDKDEPLSPFLHKLRHDAESVFWLLLWWSLQIKPEGDNREYENVINSQDWHNLTGELDGRDENFATRAAGFPRSILHPSYRPLEGLFKQMAGQLTGDHELLESRRHDEYLHEAFQRLILEFLFTNFDEPFMKLKVHDQLRKVDNNPLMSQGVASTSTNKRKRDPEDADQARRVKRPHHVE